MSNIAVVTINDVVFDGKEGRIDDTSWTEGKTYSYEEFQKKIYEADYEHQNQADNRGYDKLFCVANFTIDYDGKKSNESMQCRIDIGDGKYGYENVSLMEIIRNAISYNDRSIEVRFTNKEVLPTPEEYEAKYGNHKDNLAKFIADNMPELPKFVSSIKPAEEIKEGDIFEDSEYSDYSRSYHYTFYRVTRRTKSSCWVEKLKSDYVKIPYEDKDGYLDYKTVEYPSDEVSDSKSSFYDIDTNKPLRIIPGKPVCLKQGDNRIYQWNGSLNESVKVKGKAMNESIDNPHAFTYRLLNRLQSDCDYWLGNGGRYDGHLWAKSPEAQIAKMRELYNALEVKPEWLTKEDIDEYERKMVGSAMNECKFKKLSSAEYGKKRKKSLIESLEDFETENPEIEAFIDVEPVEEVPAVNENPEDTVSMNIPLLMRMLEFAKEDAKTDVELHDVVEKLTDLSKDGRVLTMDDYDAIVSCCNPDEAAEEIPAEEQGLEEPVEYDAPMSDENMSDEEWLASYGW